MKKSSELGVRPWTVTLLANLWAGVFFSFLWLLGGDGQPVTKLWQPTIIAGLYISGQVFMFSAIHRGDVSVATPIFGIKVVFVAMLMAWGFQETLPPTIWYAAGLATFGIGLVQWVPREDGMTDRRKLPLTILLALASAFSFACFDVLVQHWAPNWGAGRFLPISYWIVALLSLGFIPFSNLDKLRLPQVRQLLIPGTALVALQAICIVCTLAIFGDAARVNVVYALRGMWGVLLAWFVATRWGGSEATLSKKVLGARIVGATLLTTAVVMVVTAQ